SPTTVGASAAYIDAYAATGGASCSSSTYSCTDICQRINYAWAQALGPAGNGITSATVDARGFPTGPWACSVSPFVPTTGKSTVSGKLLLGFVNINTSTTWFVPSQTELRGIGTGGTATSNDVNTIITNAGISNGSVIQMGPSTPSVVF